MTEITEQLVGRIACNRCGRLFSSDSCGWTVHMLPGDQQVEFMVCAECCTPGEALLAAVDDVTTEWRVDAFGRIVHDPKGKSPLGKRQDKKRR